MSIIGRKAEINIETPMLTQIKMIVTDLDGTLLRTDKTISKKSLATLARCRDADIKVVYATGRGTSADQVAPAELFDGRITMNGAIAMIGDNVIHNCTVPYQTARPILVACDERGMRIASESGDTHYANFNVSEKWRFISCVEMSDFSQHDKDADKLYVLNPTPEEILFIKEMLPDDLYFVTTADANGFFGMILHRDATKAKAVEALAKHWNVHASEIVAFGDDFNDIDMLIFAGAGVVMENAVDEIKSVADYICDSNDDDGVAAWLEGRITN